MASLPPIRSFCQRSAIVLIACAMSACSSFFQITRTGEDGAPIPAKKPATTAAKPPADSAKPKPVKPVAPKPVATKPGTIKPAPKPVEKTPEKVAEKPPVKPAEKDSAKSPAKGGTVAPPTPRSASTGSAPAAPPAARRSEPIIEPPSVEPAAVGSGTAAVARLMHAAALWEAVRLFHPAASTERMAWDNITVRQLTDVRAATSAQDYSNVLTEWINRLNDPLSHIELATSGAPNMSQAASSNTSASVTLSPIVPVVARGKKPLPVTDTTTVIRWPTGSPSGDSAAWASVRNATMNVQNSIHVVLDLRGATATQSSTIGTPTEAVRAMQLEVADNLATSPVIGPSIRRRSYDGWPDERTVTTYNASAAWHASEPLAVVRGTNWQFSVARRIAILADSATLMPASLLALVSARQAVLISESTLTERALVPVTTLPLGDGLVATVRVGELLNSDGTIGITPDTIVARATSSDSAPALKTALKFVAGTDMQRARHYATAMNTDALLVYDGWNAQHYPSMGARLLSVFKMWSSARTFHAYNELYDENIDDAFARSIPRVEAARNADGYAAAILDFASAFDDAQATVTGPSVTQRIGAASAPFRTRWVEGRAIVTQLASGANTNGLAIGDEISAADGYPMSAYVNEHRRYGAASNDWTRLRNISDIIPLGPAGNASFRVRDASNRERALTLQRTPEFLSAFTSTARNSANAWRDLGAGIGYIDVDRVNEHNIDSAFQATASSRALVFDARTSRVVNDALLARILARVTTQPHVTLDRQMRRIALAPCAPATNVGIEPGCATEQRQFNDVLTVDGNLSRSAKRVVLLVDERTQGALEQFGLGMEAAANAVIIGSASAGASGAISAIKLPGQLTLTFSSTELRHADGRQLQRVGLTPQVDAHPTAKGIRAGTDEVLDAAHKWLVQQLDPTPVKRRP